MSATRMELVPHPDYGGPYPIIWSRSFCEGDLEALRTIPADDIQARLDSYFANFRLTLDERGPGLVDSVGDWYRLPDGSTRMITLNMRGPTQGTPGYFHADQMKRLVFLDATGRVLLIAPNYGWSTHELEEWAHDCGFDTEITSRDYKADEIARAKAFPGYDEAPMAPVGRPYYTPAPRVSLSRRLRRLLRR